MTEQAPQEAVKLSNSDQFFNFCSGGAWMFDLLATIQWTINSWVAQYKHAKRHRKPFKLRWPHTLQVFSVAGRPQMIIENLRSFGISAQGTGSQMIVENNTKGILMSILVADAQWEMADAVLEQFAEGSYVVTSSPGAKRGAVFTKRWGVTAKPRSFDEGLNGMIGGMFKDELKLPTGRNKQAKLGRSWERR